ncbi:MAG: hypothetical protein ABR498_07865 [Candidatus Dormibacteria bacterium]
MQEGHAVWEATPPPPPVEPLFSHRAIWLTAVGGVVLLAVIGGVVAVLVTNAASATAKHDAQEQDQLRSAYAAAADLLASQAATYQTAVQQAMDADDVNSLDKATFVFGNDVVTYDSSVDALNFPRPLRGEVLTVFAADDTMLQDLSAVPTDASATQITLQAWATTVGADYQSASAAHRQLATDLGLPASGFSGAPGTTV